MASSIHLRRLLRRSLSLAPSPSPSPSPFPSPPPLLRSVRHLRTSRNWKRIPKKVDESLNDPTPPPNTAETVSQFFNALRKNDIPFISYPLPSRVILPGTDTSSHFRSPSRTPPSPSDDEPFKNDLSPSTFRSPASPDQGTAPVDPGVQGRQSSKFPLWASSAFRSVDSQEETDVPLPTFVKIEAKKRPEPVALMEAIRKVKTSAKKRFVESVEVSVRLGIDPKRSDQLVRGAATLPHGTGKVMKVAVFAEGEEAEVAKAAGADVVGSDDLISMVAKSGGKLDFDKCIATPNMMPKLSKVARILGPRGLMPNPKVGTVTKNIANAVREVKKGRVDFRADKTGIVHACVGKVNFTEEALRDNIAAFAGSLLAAKPTGLKKTSKYAGYFNSFSLSSTMGPGVHVTIQSVSQSVDAFNKYAPAT